MVPFRDKAQESPRVGALRVAAVYALLALAWIFGSDLALDRVLPEQSSALWFNVAKGTGFVLFTAFVLYRWTRRELERRDVYSASFRHVVEQAPDLIFRYRLAPTPGFVYVSPAATQLIGYTPEEHYADPDLATRLIHPDDRARLESLRTGQDAEKPIELRWRHKDGSTVWVEMRYRIATDADGSPVIEGISRDITARKEAATRQELLATAIQATGDAILVCDADGVIQYVNPAFTGVTGYGLDEVVGQTPRILKSGRHAPAFYEDLWATLRAGRVFRGEFVNRRKDGMLYTQQATITPVLDEGGRIRNFVAVARDVTDERRIEAQLQHAQKHELIANMASGAAHDFKNLLAVIRANADLAAMPPVRNGTSDALNEIQRAADRGTELVRRLLALGRGGSAFDPKPGDLGATIADFGTALRSVLPRSVDLTVDVEPGLPTVRMDQGAIEQILLNLVTNARDAMPAGGRIAIRLEAARQDGTPDAAQLLLRVRDSGVGIPRELLGRIFEPFFTTHADAGGSGLGLPMVRALCDRLGALLHIESEPGQGTEVSIQFQAVSDPRPTPATAADRDAVVPHGRERILIVDDEPALRRIAERALRTLGYEVETASDGSDASERLMRESPFDLVVTDLLMPGSSGADVFRRAREHGLATRFLFVSGFASHDPDGVGLTPANANFLEKPYTIEQLANKVRTVLDTLD